MNACLVWPFSEWPFSEWPFSGTLIARGGIRVAVWLSGNALVSINVVALRRARLVLGWVTVSGIPSRCLTKPPNLLSLAILPWVLYMAVVLDTAREETASSA